MRRKGEKEGRGHVRSAALGHVTERGGWEFSRGKRSEARGTRWRGSDNGKFAATRSFASSRSPGARGGTANGGPGVAEGAAESGTRGQASGPVRPVGRARPGRGRAGAPSLPGLRRAGAPAGGDALSGRCRRLCPRFSIGCGGPGWLLGPRLSGGPPPPPLPR